MTADEFRAILAKLEVSQAQMAGHLGIGLRTVQGYAAGERIPPPTEVVLILLRRGTITLQDVDRILKKTKTRGEEDGRRRTDVRQT